MARCVCAIPRFRETLPDGTSYEVLDQVVNGPGDTFRPDHRAGRAIVRDGRQSRRQPRQPLPGRGRGVGLLPVDNLLGRVLVCFWSTDGSAEWIKPWTWFTAARWSRIGRTG